MCRVQSEIVFDGCISRRVQSEIVFDGCVSRRVQSEIVFGCECQKTILFQMCPHPLFFARLVWDRHAGIVFGMCANQLCLCELEVLTGLCRVVVQIKLDVEFVCVSELFVHEILFVHGRLFACNLHL